MSGGEEGEEEDGDVGDEHFECGCGSFCFILPVWPTPLDTTASFGPRRRYRSVRRILAGGESPRNRLMSLVGGNRGSKSQ